MANIKDVARAAGVSVSTVSHVLSGNRPISEATRMRVKETIAQLGYRPNRLAQGLVNKSTSSVGLLVPDLANPFFSDYLAVLLSRQVDGLIYFPGTRVPNAALTAAVAEGVPVVVVDERLDNLPGVFVDNFDGGRQVGAYLASLGHRSILFLGGPEGLPTVIDRLDGLRAGLEAAGAPVDNMRLYFGEYRASYGYEAIYAFAREGIFSPGAAQRPSAVVAANDLIAIGALRALRELNLRVPRDCSLVGFDGIELTSLITPSLTTVQQPFGKVATSAVQLLLSRIEAINVRKEDRLSASAVSHIILPVSLIVRESVAAPPDQDALISSAMQTTVKSLSLD